MKKYYLQAAGRYVGKRILQSGMGTGLMIVTGDILNASFSALQGANSFVQGLIKYTPFISGDSSAWDAIQSDILTGSIPLAIALGAKAYNVIADQEVPGWQASLTGAERAGEKREHKRQKEKAAQNIREQMGGLQNQLADIESS